MEQMMLAVMDWKRKVGSRRAPRRRRRQVTGHRLQSLGTIWLLPHLSVTVHLCSKIKRIIVTACAGTDCQALLLELTFLSISFYQNFVRKMLFYYYLPLYSWSDRSSNGRLHSFSFLRAAFRPRDRASAVGHSPASLLDPTSDCVTS